MTLPSLPPEESTDWYPWASGIHTNVSEITSGRLTETALDAAYGAESGVTDHGDLTGLDDDDHTQYALADGTRGDFAPTTHTHVLADITDWTGGTGGGEGVIDGGTPDSTFSDFEIDGGTP